MRSAFRITALLVKQRFRSTIFCDFLKAYDNDIIQLRRFLVTPPGYCTVDSFERM